MIIAALRCPGKLSAPDDKGENGAYWISTNQQQEEASATIYDIVQITREGEGLEVVCAGISTGQAPKIFN